MPPHAVRLNTHSPRSAPSLTECRLLRCRGPTPPASPCLPPSQREKLCRSLNTDLKAALRENALETQAVAAFKVLLTKQPKATGTSRGGLGGAASCSEIASGAALVGRLRPKSKTAGADGDGSEGRAEDAWTSDAVSAAPTELPAPVEQSEVAVISPLEAGDYAASPIPGDEHEEETS